MRGFGTVYRQPGTRFFWIQYWRDGERHRESSGQEKFREAQKVLKLRIVAGGAASVPQDEAGEGQFAASNPPPARPGSSPCGVRVSDLYDAMERNFIINKRKSLGDLRSLWKNHLKPALGAVLAHALDSDRIEVYVVARRAEGAALPCEGPRSVFSSQRFANFRGRSFVLQCAAAVGPTPSGRSSP